MSHSTKLLKNNMFILQNAQIDPQLRTICFANCSFPQKHFLRTANYGTNSKMAADFKNFQQKGTVIRFCEASHRAKSRMTQNRLFRIDLGRWWAKRTTTNRSNARYSRWISREGICYRFKPKDISQRMLSYISICQTLRRGSLQASSSSSFLDTLRLENFGFLRKDVKVTKHRHRNSSSTWTFYKNEILLFSEAIL